MAFASLALGLLVTLTSHWLANAAPLPLSERPPAVIVHSAETNRPLDTALAFLRERHTGLSDAEIPAVAAAIVEQTKRHALDLDLVLALILVESTGYNFAVSPVGARGLMQIMPPTGEELARRLGKPWPGPDALFDPLLNVELGMTYLRQLLDRYDGHLEKALTAYNAGPGFVDRRLASGARLPDRYSRLVRSAIDHQTAGRS